MTIFYYISRTKYRMNLMWLTFVPYDLTINLTCILLEEHFQNVSINIGLP